MKAGGIQGTVLSREDIDMSLQRAGAYTNRVVLLERDYIVLDRRWVREMYEHDRKERKRRGLWKWRKTNDCDNAAFRFFTKVRDAHAKSGVDEAESPGIGVFLYKVGGSGGGHAINVVWTQRGMEFVEPNEGKTFGYVKLTKEEVSSCFGVII